MTSPLWLALPPEASSALLSTGPGSGALLAAAQEWQNLSIQYSEVAEELNNILTAAESFVWQGASSEQFIAANAPFLAWLQQVSAVAAQTSELQRSAAAAFAFALEEMPTLAELAINHATHSALVGTNFFGINTIPIALNEADYTRMWVQAATVMTIYETTADEIVETTPSAAPAPSILTGASTSGETSNDETSSDAASSGESSAKGVSKLIQDLRGVLQDLRDLAANTLPGPLGQIATRVLDAVLSAVSSTAFNVIAHAVLDPIIYMGPLTPLLTPLLTPALAGTAGLAALGAINGTQPADAPVTTGGAEKPARQSLPVAISTPSPTTATPASTAPSPSTASPSTVPAAPTPTLGPVSPPPSILWAVLGPGGNGFTPTAAAQRHIESHSRTTSSATAKSGAQNVHSSRKRKSARSRGDKKLVDDGRMTLHMDSTDEAALNPTRISITASGRGAAGQLGYAGTSPKIAADARGLDKHPSTESAALIPMVPQTWTANELDAIDSQEVPRHEGNS